MFAVVLAGGENRRLPVTKGLIDLGGKKIIESVLDRLGAFFDKLAISTNEPEKYYYLGVPLIGDVYPVRGPMTGIFSALSWGEAARPGGSIGAAEDAFFAFFVACDMPFIKSGLIARMIERKNEITGSPGEWDVLAPIWQGRPEPLFSFYRASCLEKMEKNILAGSKRNDLSLRRFLEKTVTARYLDEKEVKKIDPGGRSFININTEDELKNFCGTVAAPNFYRT